MPRAAASSEMRASLAAPRSAAAETCTSSLPPRHPHIPSRLLFGLTRTLTEAMVNLSCKHQQYIKRNETVEDSMQHHAGH